MLSRDANQYIFPPLFRSANPIAIGYATVKSGVAFFFDTARIAFTFDNAAGWTVRQLL